MEHSLRDNKQVSTNSTFSQMRTKWQNNVLACFECDLGNRDENLLPIAGILILFTKILGSCVIGANPFRKSVMGVFSTAGSQSWPAIMIIGLFIH